MLETKAIILAEAQPSIPAASPPNTLTEWGLWGAVLFLCVQKGWEWFAKKESSENELVNKLIDGLRENQSQMLTQMVRMSEQSHQDIRELKEAVVQMASSQRAEVQSQNSAISEIRVALSRLERELLDRVDRARREG